MRPEPERESHGSQPWEEIKAADYRALVGGPPGPGVASLWLLPVFWVGLPTPGSLLPRTLMEPLASPARGDDFSLCLGAHCPAAWTVLRAVMTRKAASSSTAEKT